MLFRTRSILQLIVAGFMIVAALLIMALAMTARQFDVLTELSQQTASKSATAMRASRQLIEQTGAVERNARQYSILNDPALFEVYETRRRDFRNAIALLHTLDTGSELRAQIEALQENEAIAHARIVAATEDPTVNFNYPALLETAYELSRWISAWVDDQVIVLRDQTRRTQQTLGLQTLALVVTAFFVAGVFVTLITRPLKQIDKAIYQLGSGAYDKSVAIDGPRDLQLLGERLDWLRSRLTELEAQRSAFLRHVSHELKTPLAAMQESAALLNEGIVGPVSEEQRKIIHILSTNCQRLLDLIENLLRYNASSFSVLEAMPEAVSLNKMLRTVLATHELSIRSNNLHIKTKTQRLTALGDKERVRVILDNLISNAVKYSPQDGLINISLLREEEYAVFSIQDEGPGISEEDRENLFTAFYQGKAPARDHYKGTGLGLAIALEYAAASGGKLEFIPTDKGARFEARFPLSGSEKQK